MHVHMNLWIEKHLFYAKVFEIHHNVLINSCFLLWFWFEYWHEKNTWPRGFMGTFFFKNWNMHSIEVIGFRLRPEVFLCWDSSLVIYFPWLTSFFSWSQEIISLVVVDMFIFWHMANILFYVCFNSLEM